MNKLITLPLAFIMVATPTVGFAEEVNETQEQEPVLLQEKLEAQKQERVDALEAKKEVVNETIQHRQIAGEEKKIEVQEKMEERKIQMDERKQSIINNLSERMMKRLEVAIDRLEKLTDRVGSRIEKLSEHMDTSEAVLIIGSKVEGEAPSGIYAQLNALRLQLPIIQEMIDVSIGAENPQEAFGEVRLAIKELVNGSKEVHQSLKDAVSSLKAQASTMEKTAESNNISTDDDEADSVDETI